MSVDAKGHIFDLTYSLRISDYCQQDGYLYTYNEFDHGIDMINLVRLAFVQKFPLQKEGPDGTGSWISSLKSMGDGKLFLAGPFGEEKREDRILPETTGVDVFLTVFDQEFNLLSEKPIPEFQQSSSAKYFVKDGMLWVFENMDEEMGFVRLKIRKK